MQSKKVEADLLKEKSLQNKAQGLKQLEKYLTQLQRNRENPPNR